MKVFEGVTLLLLLLMMRHFQSLRVHVSWLESLGHL
jgi:hypothetical protein